MSTPFRDVVDDLTDGDGCACHTGVGYNTSCEHCRPAGDQPEPRREHVHRQRYDGDDPYLICECGARWDAISGRPLNVAAGADYPAAPTPEAAGLRGEEELRAKMRESHDCETCQEYNHSATDCYHVRELLAALAATPSQADRGLDAAVLARALANVSPTGTKYPERLAAEYARLSQRATEPLP